MGVWEVLRDDCLQTEHISGNMVFIRLPVASATSQCCLPILRRVSITTSLNLIIFTDHFWHTSNLFLLLPRAQVALLRREEDIFDL
jgi:hypothetical protein